MPKPEPAKTESETDMVQIVISNVPKELAEQIDKLAASNDRTRTAEVRQLLREIVAQRLPAKAA
jgi:hypothetical protein